MTAKKKTTKKTVTKKAEEQPVPQTGGVGVNDPNDNQNPSPQELARLVATQVTNFLQQNGFRFQIVTTIVDNEIRQDLVVVPIQKPSNIGATISL